MQLSISRSMESRDNINVLEKRSPGGGSIAGGYVNLGKLKSNLTQWKSVQPRDQDKFNNARDHEAKWNDRVQAFTNPEKAQKVADQYRDMENPRYEHAQAWFDRAAELRLARNRRNMSIHFDK
jgi:hypothetical protein